MLGNRRGRGGRRQGLISQVVSGGMDMYQQSQHNKQVQAQTQGQSQTQAPVPASAVPSRRSPNPGAEPSQGRSDKEREAYRASDRGTDEAAPPAYEEVATGRARSASGSSSDGEERWQMRQQQREERDLLAPDAVGAGPAMGRPRSAQGYGDPYAQDPYMRDPYARDAYMRDPYMGDPYMQDPYMRGGGMRAGGGLLGGGGMLGGRHERRLDRQDRRLDRREMRYASRDAPRGYGMRGGYVDDRYADPYGGRRGMGQRQGLIGSVVGAAMQAGSDKQQRDHVRATSMEPPHSRRY